MLFQANTRKVSQVPIYLNERSLSYVNVYKYLGVLITPDFKDIVDIEAKIRLFFARGNAVIRDFKYTSLSVKCHLFSVYCDIPYCSYLWSNFTVSTFNMTRKAFSQIFRKLTGFKHSVIQSNRALFVSMYVCTFDEVLRKKNKCFLPTNFGISKPNYCECLI